MSKNIMKEDLSICYLKTIAAINDISLEEIRHDADSVDVLIKKTISVGNRRFNSIITVQLKATSSKKIYKKNGQYVVYSLKNKNYNDLCMMSTTPSILALFILPENENEWVHWSKEDLLLSGQMYWLSLQGKPESSNLSSTTIKIPLENQLSVDSIETLLRTVAIEGRLS